LRHSTAHPNDIASFLRHIFQDDDDDDDGGGGGGVDFPLFCSLICLQNEAQSDSAKAKIIKEQREYLAVGERGASSL